MVTPAPSSSVMDTTVSLVVPPDTNVGRLPNVSLTDSPSSSTESWVALKVKDFSVSPLLNVMFPGTPE